MNTTEETKAMSTTVVIKKQLAMNANTDDKEHRNRRRAQQR
jgi:hypothetical protein